MVAILKALYVVFAAIFAVVFGKDVAKANKEGETRRTKYSKSCCNRIYNRLL